MLGQIWANKHFVAINSSRNINLTKLTKQGSFDLTISRSFILIEKTSLSQNEPNESNAMVFMVSCSSRDLALNHHAHFLNFFDMKSNCQSAKAT